MMLVMYLIHFLHSELCSFHESEVNVFKVNEIKSCFSSFSNFAGLVLKLNFDMSLSFLRRDTMDEEPRPGPSREKDASKNVENMTLAEYLSLPENQGANLVVPLTWCPHLETVTKDFDEALFDVKRKCENCDNVGENWICLVCHRVFCSRYVQEHSLFHSLESEHVVTLSFSDISVWCYACNDYIDNDSLYQMKNALHKNKFDGVSMPKAGLSIQLE